MQRLSINIPKNSKITIITYIAVLLLQITALALIFGKTLNLKHYEIVNLQIPQSMKTATKAKSPEKTFKQIKKKAQEKPKPAPTQEITEKVEKEPIEEVKETTEETIEEESDTEAMDIDSKGELQIDFQTFILKTIAERKIYPPSARKRGQQGLVTLLVEVSPVGKLIRVEIIKPCKHKFLNQAAIASVKACNPFKFTSEAPAPILLTVTLEYRLTE